MSWKCWVEFLRFYHSDSNLISNTVITLPPPLEAWEYSRHSCSLTIFTSLDALKPVFLHTYRTLIWLCPTPKTKSNMKILFVSHFFGVRLCLNTRLSHRQVHCWHRRRLKRGERGEVGATGTYRLFALFSVSGCSTSVLVTTLMERVMRRGFVLPSL